MNVLCIDTANGNCTIVLSKNQTIFLSHNVNEPNPAERLFHSIHSLMQQATITYSQIDIIGVVIGPGSFNGTRIAISAALGIAQVIGKPIVTINILELFVYSQNQLRDCDKVIGIIDARKNQFYYQAFNNHQTPITNGQLGSHNDMMQFIASVQPVAIITNAEPSNFTSCKNKILAPDLTLMCQFAQIQHLNKAPTNTELLYLRPLYLKS